MEYLLTVGWYYLLFGLVVTAVAGLVVSWVDRKVTAQVQMRVGPPLLQPFYDIAKYMVKETCIPMDAPAWLFLGAPLLGLAAAAAASAVLWMTFLPPGASFPGDVLVLLYLLTIPALAVILGSMASRNPLASVGGAREMKLVMAYELPFILAVSVPLIRAGGVGLAAVLANPSIGSVSGVLALVVAILCMQAKLTLVPFDMPEAETELQGGAYVEYSGPPLGVYKLTRAMMLFVLPMFVVTVFCGGLSCFGVRYLGLLKYLGLVVLIVLIRNTAPRLRTDQAVKLFWGPVTVLALIAVGLALGGL